MSTTAKQISVLKKENRVSLPREAAERDFWMSKRQALLIELAALERKLEITRRCKNCGHVQ